MEIRRQEDAERERREASRDSEKLKAIQNLDGKVSSLDSRLNKIEGVASRSQFRTLPFWFSLIAILVSLMALFRDYWGWTAASPSRPVDSQPFLSTSGTNTSAKPGPAHSSLPHQALSNINTAPPLSLPLEQR